MFNRNAFRPKLESLDGRIVPAGNVMASAGEVLEIRGDAAANQVTVTQTADGIVTVSGQNGTLINGRASVRFAGARLEKTDIRLFGGADSLTVNNLRVSVDQNVEMGAGNDVVVLNDARAGANVSVKTEDGFDRVTATGVVAGGDFFIDTAEGRSAVSVRGTTVGKSLTVIGKNSADAVAVSGVTTGEDMKIEVGEGDDRVELTNARVGKNLGVDADKGNDFVSVTKVSVASDAVFLGGDALDTFRKRGVTAGQKLEVKEFDRFV